MVKLLVKIVTLLVFWRPTKWRKNFKAKFASSLYAIAIRRRAKKCGSYVNVLGEGVNVTPYTTIGHGAGFGKGVKIRGDGPVFIGKFAAIAEDTLIYTQVHDYDHSKILPFGGGFTYPETRIGDYAWIGMRAIILPGADIGEGAIVQAGSVVMGKVPPCAIVAGNPAKVIGWRDMEHYNGIKVGMGEKPVEVLGNGERGRGKREQGTGNREQGTENGDTRLTDVFCRVFSVSPEEAMTMTYKNHPAWDSAGQMALVAAMEHEFGYTLTPEDIYRLRSYQDALKMVESVAKPYQPPTTNHQPPTTNYQLPTTNFFNLDRDGIAVIYDGREISFRELKAMGDKLISGIAPRSVKFIRASTSPETIALFAACVNNGIVPLMLPENIDQSLYDKLHSTYAAAKVHEDLALLLSTSGSTGSPKLVRTSYANLDVDCVTSAENHHLSAGDRFMIPLPLCYAFGVQVLGACLKVGATMVISSKGVVDPGFADVVESSKATHFVGVPYMYEMLDRLDFFARPFPLLKNLSISGGALGPALRRKYAQWTHDTGRIFCEIYGQTETLAYMAVLETNDHLDKIGSLGKASSGGFFTLKDDGALLYHGPIVAMGYAYSAADLLKGDEWKGVRETGDMATIDADGYVTLTGRASRFIKIFGNRVSLQEVENIVKDNFPQTQSAAVGRDNKLTVFISDGDLAQDVERLLVRTLHFNTTAMEVRVLDAIPLNANDKVDYPRLEKMAE